MLSWLAQTAIHRVVGGQVLFKTLSERHPEKLVFLGHPKFVYKIKSAIYWSLFCLAGVFDPPVLQRMLMSQDKRQVRRVWYISAIFYTIIVCMVVLIGLAIVAGEGSDGIFDRAEYLKQFTKRINSQITAATFEDLVPYLVKRLFERTWALDCMFVGIVGVLLSTIDSYLHGVGVLFVQDIVVPVRAWCGFKALRPNRKGTYARMWVAVIGIFALIVGCIQGSADSWFNDSLYEFPYLTYVLVIIPLILGIIGIKTDKVAWISFCSVYLLVMGGFRWGMGVHKYDSFIMAVLLGVVAFFVTHMIRYRGLVTLKRSKQTTAEQLWMPTWGGIVSYVGSWLLAPLRLPALARGQLSKHGAQPLAFSLVVFALYTFSSFASGGLVIL